MDARYQALQDRAAQATRTAGSLDPEEVRVLQRFYDQLCALVEAQRMSDPLLLMVVHGVRPPVCLCACARAAAGDWMGVRARAMCVRWWRRSA